LQILRKNKYFLFICLSLVLLSFSVFGETGRIRKILIKGNKRIEAAAIIQALSFRSGENFSAKKIKESLLNLYDLGFFKNIQFYQQSSPQWVDIIIQLKEKPSISEIIFVGLKQITEKDIREKLLNKQYMIIDDGNITSDVRMITQELHRKGYHLANVSYELKPHDKNNVVLHFYIEEGKPLEVGEIHLLGNQSFQDSEILEKLLIKPKSRLSFFGTSSYFQAEILERDVGFIAYFYKDHGFVHVKVAKSLIYIDSDHRYVRIIYRIEEGQKYSIDTINLVGDLLFPTTELKEKMHLKPGSLFRLSDLSADIKRLGDLYGDLGYAYVDINPQISYDDKKLLAKIDYHITKGEKIYFGKINIIGNSRTRDNVIRRELKVYDSELYSITGLMESRRHIQRLGFFETVEILKKKDKNNQEILDLKIKVKEKPTGEVSFTFGYAPGKASGANQIILNGNYGNKNGLGKAWVQNLSLRWEGNKDYEASISFSDPRINDSLWLGGMSANISNYRKKYIGEQSFYEKRKGISLFFGRRFLEDYHGSLRYKIEKISPDYEDIQFIIERFRHEGLASSIILALGYNTTNNHIDPSSGVKIDGYQQFTGGYLGGDHAYMKSTLEASYYIPLPYTKKYLSFFRLIGHLSYIYPYSKDGHIPFGERFKLGGPRNLRGYSSYEIGPSLSILKNPQDIGKQYRIGGDKLMFYQLEYLIPIIPDVGLRGVVFTDIGGLYGTNQLPSLKHLYYDVGFGIRWLSPLGPFRFEIAYPVEDGKIGDAKTQFSIRY